MFREKVILGAAAFAVLLSSIPSSADPGPEDYSWYFFNGKMLLEACDAYVGAEPSKDKEKAAYDAGRCAGAIAATADILGLHKDALAGGWLPVACIPNDVEIIPLVQVVVEYGRNHPEYDDSNAQNVVRNALAEKYPCAHGPAATCDGDEESCG
ncbi:hypothetical protein CDO28_01480 [Sinorhizobium meliloti]|uniref:Rap1a/Tai family immunity protein n=1 Tax=Rhizobium meliloti TaxID=382 RepID=UPI000B49E065|nr:Rap1a/Tai family immunity protein [Sinorhizobium meliloti]ASP70358.1 hypothetical protein CDO28_01480 [Sinorhizobium meliloti]MDE3854793.1 hypothetical protein [Sinorhizobium meliloti]MQW52471.1 hypothetical protein [Sinorhizobium meliloti]